MNMQLNTQCAHYQTILNIKNPNADGINDAVFIQQICAYCNQLLVTYEESIVGNWATVYNEEYARKNRIEQGPY